jgi:hypothetical protein
MKRLVEMVAECKAAISLVVLLGLSGCASRIPAEYGCKVVNGKGVCFSHSATKEG